MLGRVWAWAVVVPLLVGLFAMHGVQAATGPAHVMPMMAPAPHSARAVPVAAHAPHPDSYAGSAPHTVAGSEGEEASAAFGMAAGSGDTGTWGPAGMSGHGAMMCLALLVLLAFALVMTRAPWSVRRAAMPRGARPPRRRDRRPQRGPPVYLRLCVFRL